jgi:hypothetical protein
LITPRCRADGLDENLTQKLGIESVKASRQLITDGIDKAQRDRQLMHRRNQITTPN